MPEKPENRSPLARARERTRRVPAAGPTPAHCALCGARTCTCRGHPQGRLGRRGAGADGAVLRAPASLARGCTHLRNPRRPLPSLRSARGAPTERAPKPRDGEEAAGDAATLGRGGRTALGAAEGVRTAPAPERGPSRERPGGGGRRGWGRGGAGPGGPTRSRAPGSRRGCAQVPGRGLGGALQVPQRAVSLGTERAGPGQCFLGLGGRSRVHCECDGLTGVGR